MQQKFQPYYNKLLEGIGSVMSHFDFIQGEHDFLFEKKNKEISHILSFGKSGEYNKVITISAFFYLIHEEIDFIKKEITVEKDKQFQKTKVSKTKSR